MADAVNCKWCDQGDQPTVLDRDGVLSSISGKPGLWAHAYEAAVVAWDEWWPCQRKAAEEHAEVERLQTDRDRVREQRDHAWEVLAKTRSAVEAGDCDPMSLAFHLAMCPRLQEREEYYAVVDHEAAEAAGEE